MDIYTVYYYHDHYQVIEEQNQLGQLQRTYVQGRYLDEPILHIVDKESFKIYNITQDGHTFHPENVEHIQLVSEG